LKLIYKEDRDFFIDCCLAEGPMYNHFNSLSRLFINKNFNSERKCEEEFLKGPTYYNSDWIEWFEESLAKEVREEGFEVFLVTFTQEMKHKFFKLIEENELPINQLKMDYNEGKLGANEYGIKKDGLLDDTKESFFNLMNESIILHMDMLENSNPSANMELIRQIRGGVIKTMISNIATQIQQEETLNDSEENKESVLIKKLKQSFIDELNPSSVISTL